MSKSKFKNENHRHSIPRASKTRKLLNNNKLIFIFFFVIAVLKAGVWVFPAIGASFRISQSPFVNPFSNPGDHYLMQTWLGSYLAHVIGINSIGGFIFLHLLFSIAAVITMFFNVKKYVHRQVQSKAYAFLAFVPGLITIFYWIGMDSLTILLLSLGIRYMNSRLTLLVLGTLSGLHHFEISSIAIISLFVYETLLQRTLKPSTRLVNVFTWLLGVFSGKLLLGFIFRANDVNIEQSRIGYGLKELSANSFVVRTYAPIVYWSMFGALWLVVFGLFRLRNRNSIAFAVALTIPCTVVLFVRDQSRVLQLTSFVLVNIAIVLNNEVLKSLSPRFTTAIIVVALLIPWIWVWQVPRSSILTFTLRYLASRYLHWDVAPVSPNITMWPFP